jgi:hypothetical protein
MTPQASPTVPTAHTRHTAKHMDRYTANSRPKTLETRSSNGKRSLVMLSAQGYSYTYILQALKRHIGGGSVKRLKLDNIKAASAVMRYVEKTNEYLW